MHWHTLLFLHGDKSYLCDVSTTSGKSLLWVLRQAKRDTEGQTTSSSPGPNIERNTPLKKALVLGLHLLDLMLWSCLLEQWGGVGHEGVAHS